MTPELPFQLPAEANTTNIRINTSNGISTTDVSFETTSTNAAELQADIEKQLTDEGWSVSTADGMVAANKGTQQMAISIHDAGGSTDVTVQWIH